MAISQTIRRFALAALAALALLATGCAPPTPAPTPPDRICRANLVRPTLDDELAVIGWTIKAVAVANCVGTPIRHTMRVVIERETATGFWEPVLDPAGKPYAQCDTIPSPGFPVQCTRYVWPCRNGHYRTNVTIIGATKAEPFEVKPEEAEKPDNVIECP